MKRLLELTTDDLAKTPIWRCQGEGDDLRVVFPASEFANPEQNGYIARTHFVLADGSEWWGYCSPTDDSGLDYIQPVIIATEGHVRFWYDNSPPELEPARAGRLLGKHPDEIFPVRFKCIVPFEGECLGGVLVEVHVP